jgi:glycerate kinase
MKPTTRKKPMQIALTAPRANAPIAIVAGAQQTRQVREKIALALIYEATNRKPAASMTLQDALENLISCGAQKNATLIAEIEVIQHRLH